MNKVFLTGRIVKPINLSFVGNSIPFAEVCLAVEDAVQNRQKVWETRVDQMEMEIWRSLARYAKEQFSVGDCVEIEACLRPKAALITVEITSIKKAINT